MKKTVLILVGIMLVSFGIGFISLIHYGIKFYDNGVGRGINIFSNDASVQIGPHGIFIQDGDDLVNIGPGGIKIHDGSSSINIGPGLSFLFSGKQPGELIEETVNEQEIVDLVDVKIIKITSSFVDVNLIPEKRDDLRIHYNGYIRASDIPKLTVEKTAGTLSISLAQKNSNSNVNSKAKLDLYIPEEYKDAIKASTSSGDITLSDLALTDVSFSASSGDITIAASNIKTLAAKSSSGDIIVQDFSGDFNGKSSSGKIKLHFAQFANNISAAASSGDIEIQLPAVAEFNLSSNTSSGNIAVEFPITVSQNTKNSLSGRVGDSQHTIDINTSSGNIKIKLSND
ncbi:MAG: DUF4097 family beta strand repeat-containing protein [Desulfitobacteriaceae bacterium]|nr:DUF4097 family beta strand repeat-containing protein [Eubacteriales bacterium]MDD4402466.1 DUF4097 family beta strand repeat-containing protein [Desulfitobacteriaceae bacterium]